MHDGSYFPVVKDITERGSAYREGSIKTGAIMLAVDGRSCRDITLVDLKTLVHDAACLHMRVGIPQKKRGSAREI